MAVHPVLGERRVLCSPMRESAWSYSTAVRWLTVWLASEGESPVVESPVRSVSAPRARCGAPPAGGLPRRTFRLQLRRGSHSFCSAVTVTVSGGDVGEAKSQRERQPERPGNGRHLAPGGNLASNKRRREEKESDESEVGIM